MNPVESQYMASIVKNPLQQAPSESVNDILLSIRDIISDMYEQSDTIKAKIVGMEPVNCGGNSTPDNPCLIDWLQIIRSNLREISQTLVDANRNL